MYRVSIAFVLTALTMMSCMLKANPALSTADSESVKEAIIRLQQQWEAAFNNKDAAALANLYTDDCVRMPNGGPTTIGRQGLEAAYRKEFAEIWRTKFDESIKTDEVVVCG
jgi:ketosteroid isomerase-like protein